MNAELEFYATPGVMTDLGPHADVLATSDINETISLVQGLLLHTHWSDRYGVSNAGRDDEVQTRSVQEMLDAVLKLDDRPLTQPRDLDRRLLINCRHFSTLTTAILRAAGVPARARCGFGAYFQSGKRVDHWVVERWNGQSWVLTDAQIDDKQRKVLSLPFDPLDVPRDAFLVAGEAWRRVRDGEDDGENYGIFDMWGKWFIEGNVPRDLASLNKVELLPWDGWGVMISGDTEQIARRDAIVERAADVTLRADFDEVRALYDTDELRVPPVVTAFGPAGGAQVRVF